MYFYGKPGSGRSLTTYPGQAGVRKALVGHIRTMLELYDVLKRVFSVVNFIRSHVLNHCQFQAILEEIDYEFSDFSIGYSSEVTQLR